MDAHEQAYLDRLRWWYGSGEGRDIDAPVSGGDRHATRLHRAARHGWCSAIRWLLVRGANVEAKADRGFTPLHDAAAAGRRDAAVVLLDAGADVNAGCGDFLRQSTSLHFNTDVNRASCKVFKLLLSRGASLDVRNVNGLDPEAHARVCKNRTAAALFAGVRAAGGWAAYVAAPRNQLLAFRRLLPALRPEPPSAPAHLERLFLDPEFPEDVFMHVFTFWRCNRDLDYFDTEDVEITMPPPDALDAL